MRKTKRIESVQDNVSKDSFSILRTGSFHKEPVLENRFIPHLSQKVLIL